MNKYTYLLVLQGDYGRGWEDLTAETTWREARARAREYRENEGGTYRTIKRRELNVA